MGAIRHGYHDGIQLNSDTMVTIQYKRNVIRLFCKPHQYVRHFPCDNPKGRSDHDLRIRFVKT